MQTCKLCRGRLESATTTVTREIGGGRVQVQGVPVDRCVDCGEEWFRARELKAVEAMIAANAGADALVYEAHKASDDTCR